jgi:FO synthase subunit 1
MEPAAARQVLAAGARHGCTEALFTFGERPEEEAGFSAYLSRFGYNDILSYCYDLCATAIQYGILPHTNAGVLTSDEMARLQEVNASMGLMLETTAPVKAHANSPGKNPEARIAMIEDAGRLRIPFTTGLLLGIGETMADREESLMVIADLHRKYGHIQEVIIQNLCPKPGTPMAGTPEISTDELCTVIMLARGILPDDVAIQVAPNLTGVRDLIPCGVNDLGGISPLTIDYVNPEHPWPEIDRLRTLTGNRVLRARLCIYPRYIRKGWYPDRLKPLIMHLEQQVREQDGSP